MYQIVIKFLQLGYYENFNFGNRLVIDDYAIDVILQQFNIYVYGYAHNNKP